MGASRPRWGTSPGSEDLTPAPVDGRKALGKLPGAGYGGEGSIPSHQYLLPGQAQPGVSGGETLEAGKEGSCKKPQCLCCRREGDIPGNEMPLTEAEEPDAPRRPDEEQRVAPPPDRAVRRFCI